MKRRKADKTPKKNGRGVLLGAEGFTLIEMIISFAIIALLSGMALSYNQSSNRNIVLFTEQAKVIGVLNRAKAFALERYQNGSTEYCAFGVAFGPGGAYSVIAVPTPSSGACVTATSAASADTIESHTLDKRVDFKTLPSGGSILFKAPYLTTYNPGTVTIEVTGATPAAEASIEVTAGGSISSI